MCALVAAALAACGPPPAGVSGAVAPMRAGAQSGLRDDRVTVTRGTVIRAVNVGRRWIYAATGDAVIVYDRSRRAWLPPFTRDGGFDPSLVRSIAVDPDDDSAWLLTSMGAWTLEPLTAFVMRVPAGPLPARLRTSTLEAVYREFPSLEGFGRLLSRDDAMQSYPVVSGARAPDRTEVWLGTAGGGLWQVDPLFNRGTSVPYGLAASGAGALARAADGVWMAPASRAFESRGAITFASRDLQQWRWLDDASHTGFGGARATALAVGDGVLWMGTTRALYRLPTTGEGARAFTPLQGLPSDLVWSVLPHRGGLWVGTERGLSVLADASPDARAAFTLVRDAADVPVRALLATGDTVWVGTDAGLMLHAPGAGGTLVRPAAAATDGRLRQPVRALAAADSSVFLALRDGVLSYDMRRGVWSEPWPAAAWRAVGDIDVLAADAHSVWAAGALGVIAVHRATGGSRLLRTGSDLPDAVTSIVLDGAWAWVGTLRGVVRVRRTADGLVP